MSPTTFTEGVIYKCNNPVAAPTLGDPLEQAYGVVHHYLQNTTLAEFALSSANKSFTDSVYCITNGVYSVSLQVNLTSMFATSYDINPVRKLAAPIMDLVEAPMEVKGSQWETESATQTSASGVEVRYTFTFSFPAPSGNGGLVGSAAYQNMYLYFNHLKSLIIDNTVNGEFDIALDHVYSSNGFPTTYSYPQPLVFGPFYLTPAVSAPSSANTAAISSAGASGMSGKLGLIIGVVVGLLCVSLSLLLAFMLYRQRKRDREQEMEQWAMNGTSGDINIFKHTRDETNTEGINPGLAALPKIFTKTLANVRNSVRRLSTRMSAKRTGCSQPNSRMNSPRGDLGTPRNPATRSLESARGGITPRYAEYSNKNYNNNIDAAFELNPRPAAPTNTRRSSVHRGDMDDYASTADLDCIVINPSSPRFNNLSQKK